MSKKPHAVVLLDESGSMGGVRDSVVSTFNEFAKGLVGKAKTISLYTFDSTGIREKISKVKVENVRELSNDDYQPNAMTPLYDSISNVIDRFKDSKRPVQVVIHTDGYENDSKEHTFESIKSKIDSQISKGWLFVYLGEGLSGQAAMKGFSGVKMNFTNNAMRGAAMKSVSDATQFYAATGSTDASLYTGNSGDEINVELGQKVSA